MNNLGNALMSVGRHAEAAQQFSRAIAIRPNYAEALSNLGTALEKQHKLTDAIAACQRALQLNPNLSQAWTNLGNALRQQGRISESIAAYRQSLQIAPNNHLARRHLLTALNFSPEESPQSIAAEHRKWGDEQWNLYGSEIRPHSNDRSPTRPLRIGYVSADFKDQVVAAFLHRVLEHHDKSRFHIVAYSDVPHPDSFTARFQTFCDVWRDILQKTDDQVANQIRSDRIDLLIDLMGHIEGNRLAVFARKPAPIQITWLGYPNTTGLRTIDYRLTDAIADPPGQTETLHTEHLFRLPQSFLCYGPLHEVPVASPPFEGNGHITFGCFNDLQKVNVNVIALWSELLQRIPSSRVVLKARSLIDPGTADYIRQQFTTHGIPQSRLDLIGWQPTAEAHLQSYSQIDIALDPFPYNGTTTTCEALWHGVPIIALAGPTHVARVSTSILTNIGLPNLVANDPAGYLAIVAALANDLPRLLELRQTLRQRMIASPLMDAPTFTCALEDAYQDMWTAWCHAAENRG